MKLPSFNLSGQFHKPPPWPATERRERPLERRIAERRRPAAGPDAEARLRQAAQAAGLGLWEFDCASGETRCSPALKAVAGLPEDDAPLPFERFAALVHPADRQRVMRGIEAALERPGNEEVVQEYRLVRQDGSVRRVLLRGRAFFAAQGGQPLPLGITGMVIDRTPGSTYAPAAPPAIEKRRLVHELQVHQVELEMQNEELREARSQAQTALERYAELYDFAPVGYFSLGRDGSIRQLNLAGARLLGSERGKLVDRRFGLFVAERDRAGFQAFLDEVFAGHGRETCEQALFATEEGAGQRVVGIEAEVDEAGHSCRAVVIDITDRKRAEDELLRSNLELQQFAYIAAHDLQTPLRSINGFAQLLQREYHGIYGAQADHWIEQVVRHVHRMQALIEDLLAYSRVESPGRRFVDTDFGQVFEEVVASLDESIRESGATVTRDPLPVIYGDRVQLAQLLQNLVENSIKYRGEAPPQVHVSARQQAGEWVFSVRDNGIGIAPEHHLRVFEIFSRLHTQQAYPGTGIGLAICSRIVQRHGGRIWVQSEAGQGSVFHFALPDRSRA